MKIRWVRSAKLSSKIAVIYALLLSLVLIVLGGVIFFGVKYYLWNQATQRLEEISLATTAAIVGNGQEQTSIHDSELVSYVAQDLTVNIKIADPSGIVVNDSNNFIAPDMKLLDQTNIYETTNGILVETFPVQKDGLIIAYVQIAQNMKVTYGFLETLLKWMVISDTLGIVLSFLAGWLVSKNMLKPIHKIMRLANEIGSSDLSTRIEVPPSNDELSQLSATFNAMLDRIEKSFIKQGRFTADASHELRTPLTVIQGYIGMLDRWGKKDEKILQEAIDAIKSETDSMKYIMERLLFLAKGDSGAQIVQKEEFDVGEMLGELEKETRILAPDNVISFQYTEPLFLCADRNLIKQCLRAILDNSIKYTPKDGLIELTCRMENENLIFKLKDTGIGIPAEDQKRVFERFYRVDTARDRRTGGSGLGLSIVEWIVKAHDGHINIESKDGTGTVVTLSLPLEK